MIRSRVSKAEKRHEKLALQVDMEYRHLVDEPTGEIPV
jgi:hypothetical protein